jgi:FkbM family methyltransferase
MRRSALPPQLREPDVSMNSSLDGYVKSPLPIERELRSLFRRDATLTIFDIGACEGEDSVRYARLFPRSTVYAVEPLPVNVRRIQSTVERYRARNVRVLPFALSDIRGKASLFVSAGHPPDIPVSDEWDYGNKSSSLLEPGRHLEVHPWVRFDEVIEVETRTLADVCADYRVQRVDLIHMDVQGAELKVLDGLGPLLEGVTAIWLEVEAVPLYLDQPLKDDIEGYLRARGFEMMMDTVDDISGDQLWVGRLANARSVWSGFSAAARRLSWAVSLRMPHQK